MSAWEPYLCPCPRCGYPDSVDRGPYEYEPGLDDALGGPPDPRLHLLWCGRCRKPFDVASDDLVSEIRDWARDSGMDPGADGELPDYVVAAWQYRNERDGAA